MDHPARLRVLYVVLMLKAFGMWEQVVSLYGSPGETIRHLFYGDYVGFTDTGILYVTDTETWDAHFVQGEWFQN